MARHDEKTSVGRAKVLSGGDTGYRLAEVDEVLGCLVVQAVEHRKAEPERDQLRYIDCWKVNRQIDLHESKYGTFLNPKADCVDSAHAQRI